MLLHFFRCHTLRGNQGIKITDYNGMRVGNGGETMKYPVVQYNHAGKIAEFIRSFCKKTW